MILHGNNDSMVPFKSSKRIYKLAGTKYKRLVELDGINHEVMDGTKDEVIIKEIKHFFFNKYYKNNTVEKI